jgi:phenylalanyl-tRNA synthetase beta chain
MELGIFTDSSTIYKHALDTKQCLAVLCHTVELVKELSGGVVASEIIDLNQGQEEEILISLSVEKINKHLGTNLSKEDIKKILTNLGYTIKKTGKIYMTVIVPQWRKDIEIAEDIHEDIGRIYGLSNIKLELPRKEIKPSKSNKIFEVKKNIGNILSNIGCHELRTYNFTDIPTLQKCNQDVDLAYHIKNALAPELSLMRTSILSTLLTKGSENVQRGIDEFAIYEFNIAHHKGEIDNENIPAESWYLSLLLTSAKNNISGSPYYQAKKYLEKALRKLGYKDIEYTLVNNTKEQDLDVWVKNLLPIFDPNSSALVYIDKKIIGIIGEIDMEVRSNFKLPDFTCGFELNVNTLTELDIATSKYEEIPKYPSVTKDLCFEMDKDVTYSKVEEAVEHSINNNDLWGRVTCMDIYMREKDDDKKRITFSLEVKNRNKTLNDKDITNILNKIENNVKKRFEAILI